MEERIVDIDMWMSVLKELIEKGETVPVTVTGNSMSPFLVHKRDVVLVEKAKTPFRRGDIVFFQRPGGQYVLHRIFKIKKDNTIWIVGDAQTALEGPVPETCIFGKVPAVKRKDVWLRPGSFWWGFFAGPWLVLRPFRRIILKVWRVFRRMFS